jgi:FAD:protein FMN transferase
MTPRWMTIAVLVSFAALAGGISTAHSADTPRPVAFRTQTMGTWATLTIVTADSAAVADLAYQSLLVLHRVDSLMSNWTDVSDVARINREAGKKDVVVHPEIARVLTCAQQVTHDSGGAFDITVEPLVRLWGFLGGKPHVPDASAITAALARVGPDKIRFTPGTGTIRFARDDVRIDLGGIAKGYGVDQVADLLRHAGATNALIDLSGNMVALGNAAGHTGWTVGVRDPSGKNPYIARIHLYNEAIATSGDYEQFVDADGKRFGHILDPRTGWSAHGLSSVTVVSRQGMLCDAWATALFVLGPEKAREVAHAHPELDVVLVEPQPGGPPIIWIEEALRGKVDVDASLHAAETIRTF